MCGINGVINYDAASPGVDRGKVERMRDAMALRGPDASGFWSSPDNRVGFGHRRLAILDLSDAGRQPMASPGNAQVITFNGEIYNFLSLRAALEQRGFKFSTQCDTEVILALFRDRGPEMFKDLRGMFAFGIWDVQSQTLYLVRDVFGIKPLYYTDDGKQLYFASQVKPLLQHAGVSKELDPVAQCGYFLMGSVPEPHTLFKNIKQLPPGHYMKISLNGAPQIARYAGIEELVQPDENPIPAELPDLRKFMEESIRLHLLSDAPCGFFLSAGIDSSTLVGCAATFSSQIRTITLGFEEYRGTSDDETILAEKVAKLYNTRHQTFWVNHGDFQHELELFISAMDQPSIDGLNSYFISKTAHEAGLTVVLSGLGADEIFGGYQSFVDIPKSASMFGWLNSFPALGTLLRAVSAPLASRITSPKYSGVFEYGGTFPGAYFLRRGLYMPWELNSVLPAAVISLGRTQALNALLQPIPLSAAATDRQKVSYLELSLYMRNQLLRDTDWASMAHSLEVRVPYVDPQVLRLASAYAARGTPLTKQDLPKILARPLPKELVERPKTGFQIPVKDWLLESHPELQPTRGLRGWAQLVYAKYLESCGVSAD